VALSHHADRVPNSLRRFEHVEPRDASLTRVGAREGRQNLDGRRLAGPVRAQQAEDGSGLNPERDVVQRLNLPVCLSEIGCLNRFFHCCSIRVRLF
jgi:hypothetical protein